MLGATSNNLVIQTPEGVIFSLQLAGPVSRFLAWLVDMATIFAMMGLVNSLLGVLGILSRDLAGALNVLAYFVTSIGYGIFAEWRWRGQTLGKRLLRLRVVDRQGLRLQFSQIVIRNLLRFVDSLPLFYLVGGLACLMNRHAQRLGDLAANTIVTWNPQIPEPDLDQLLEGKYNSLREYPHLEARLRQRVSAREAQLALQSLLRRDTLEPSARLELFRTIASHFKTHVSFPEEAVEGISDEQYVRNVVETLFRTKKMPKIGR